MSGPRLRQSVPLRQSPRQQWLSNVPLHRPTGQLSAKGGDSQREYESIDSDFCAVNNLNCGVDREVFSQPGCGCGCQRRACTAELDVVCGQNGQRYNNACLMTQAGQQETEDWVSAGCCEAYPKTAG